MELKKINNEIEYDNFNIEEKYDTLSSIKNSSIKSLLINDGVDTPSLTILSRFDRSACINMRSQRS